MLIWIALSAIVVIAIGCGLIGTRRMDIWAPAYIMRALRGRPRVVCGPVHVMVCIADHFEPAWNNAGYEQERARVQRWTSEYPRIASRHNDNDGVAPQYTFFYPAEQYRREHLDALAQLCRDGYGDVEIHLHHRDDTSDSLRKQLLDFKQLLHEVHGLLHVNPATGVIEYGFIHGDWALGNSARHGRFCGVDDELAVLRETGCYGDFTLPSAPSETQTRKVNSVYYAGKSACRRKPHNTGPDSEVGRAAPDQLVIVQGPLGVNWRSRKWGILPRIETGELSADNPPTRARVDLWVRQHIHVKGRPEWIFVKLYAHGANERNMPALLGQPMDDMFSYLETAYNDGTRYRLHYVTARELYNIVKAAESGMTGDPNQFRKFGSRAVEDEAGRRIKVRSKL